jgi:hypothetical protein
MIMKSSRGPTTRWIGLCAALIYMAGGDVDCYGQTILLAGDEMPFRAVAQMVGFGLGRSKMLYLSMGLTDTLTAS